MMLSIRLRDILTLIGIALSLLGVTYGMYGNFIFPIVKWSPIIMLVSALLLINYKNLFRLRFPSYSGVYGLLIFFQLLMMLYGGFSEKMDFKFLSFHLYILTLIIAYSSLSNRDFFTKIPEAVFYTSILAVCLGVFFTVNKMVEGEEVYLIRLVVDDYALETFTVLQGVVINAVAGLCMDKTNKWKKILYLVFLGLDFYVLLSYSKRSPVFFLLLAFLFYGYTKGFIRFNLRMIKVAFVLVFTFLILYTQIEFVEERVDRFAFNFYTGVLNLFGDTSIQDYTGSAVMRYEYRRAAFDDIDTNFTAFNWVFGGGYMRAFIDAPILQAYIDMGIMGFLFYLFFIVIYPFKILLNKIRNNVLLFAFLCSLSNVAFLISGGHIYSYSSYTYFCLLVFVVIQISKKKQVVNSRLETWHPIKKY